jgi:hypothetical protein
MAPGEAWAASLNGPKLKRFQSLADASSAYCRTQRETSMLEKRPLISIGAMAYARELKGDFDALKTGSRTSLYKLLGRALTSYQKFLKDPVGEKELLSQDNISGLREKPELKKTSRLLLYHLIDARSDHERTAAGKLAQVVDYLHQQGIGGDVAAAYIRNAGGKNGILKKKQKRRAPKAVEETEENEASDFEVAQDQEEAQKLASLGDAARDFFERKTDAAIRMGREPLARLWEIPEDEIFYLKCKKKGSLDPDWAVILGMLVDAPSE